MRIANFTKDEPSICRKNYFKYSPTFGRFSIILIQQYLRIGIWIEAIDWSILLFTLEKDTPKEMATKAYSTYEKFGDTEYEEKQLIEVLKMYKDIAKEFMLEYGPVLEFIWQLAVPNQVF
jgi:hypothetical protein